MIACAAGPSDKTTLSPEDDIGGDDVKRQLGILQIAIGQILVDQLLDAIVRDQEIPTPEKPEHGAPIHRENVMTRQSAPDGLQLQDAFQGGIAGIVSAVQSADTGADHHIGGDAVRGKRVHHAHLNGAEAASAGEHEGGFCWSGLIGHGPRCLPGIDAPKVARRFDSVIAAENQAAPSIVGVG